MNEIAEITTEGIVEGIDFSESMLKQADKANKHHILKGTVRLHKGECMKWSNGNGHLEKSDRLLERCSNDRREEKELHSGIQE